MSDEAPTRLIDPKRIVLQIVAFVAGVGLLSWCIALAVGDGTRWQQVFSADPRLVMGLVGCSVVSLVANGVVFWVVIRPVRRFELRPLVLLNFATAVLNYAPVRAGLIARVAYHLRVDQMRARQIAAWFLALTIMLAVSLGACVLATVVRPTLDLLWLAIMATLIIIGSLALRVVGGHRFIAAIDTDLVTMLVDPSARWSGLLLRLLDIGAFVGRMACAAAILDLSLSASDTMLIGFAALFMSLNPLGRVGFREITVAFIATRLASTGTDHLDEQMAALAVIESAGEAMAAVPLGIVGLIWYRSRWRSAPPRSASVS